MRNLIVLIAVTIAFAPLSLRAQKPAPASVSPHPDYLPAGPFFFAAGAVHPTYMDWVDARPVVASPNGKLAVTVTRPKESYGAWVTLDPSTVPGGPVRIWPIQRNVDVLWRPDSRAFALTDDRYANRSYVLVCGTRFRMGESGPELGIPITDLTPVVRKAFETQVQKYYAPHRYETRLFYAKALRWTENDQLLVGVSAMIAGPPALANRGIREWNLAYLVDIPRKKVVDVLSEAQLLSQYGIGVAK